MAYAAILFGISSGEIVSGWRAGEIENLSFLVKIAIRSVPFLYIMIISYELLYSERSS
jgi:hypothetical protein